MSEIAVITKPRRHAWPKAGEPGFSHTSLFESKDGNECFERECKFCGVVRITKINPRGRAWHEWKAKGAKRSFQMESTPPCLDGETLREYSEVKAL